MQFLPLLGQDGAQLVKTFDEAGFQTSPPLSDSSLISEPATLLDFMSSFEELDEIISGFDTAVTPASQRDDDAAAAPPPTYADAVTQSDTSSTLGLDLDRSRLVSGSSPRLSSMTSKYGGPMQSLPDDTLARSSNIGHSLNPVPHGIYMRARPMIWDATSSAAATHEPHTLGNNVDNHCPSQVPTHPAPKCSVVPPWRHPSIAQTAFETASTYQGDVFGPYTHAPGACHHQFDTAPHHRMPRSLAYPPPPLLRNHNPYFGSDARIDPWMEHAPPRDTPLPAYGMPGTYPPSPPLTNIAPSYDLAEVYSSALRHRQGSLVRRTSSIHHGCESCYPSPPASPSSSVRADSTCSNRSSPSGSPMLDLHLSLHSPSHPSSALHHDLMASPAHTTRMCSLNLTPPPSPEPTRTQPSVVMSISITLPAPCSRHDRLTHRISSLFTVLVPLVFLVPLAAYAFGASTARSSSSSGGRERGSGSESLFHGPLIWRALSSLLSYILRMMRDGDVKI